MRELTNNQIAERIIAIDLKENQFFIQGIVHPILMKRINNLIEIGKRKGFVEIQQFVNLKIVKRIYK